MLFFDPRRLFQSPAPGAVMSVTSAYRARVTCVIIFAMGNCEICVRFANIVVPLLLSVAAAPAAALANDGLWSAHGRWPFSDGLAPRKVPSAAAPAYVSGDAEGLVH